MISHRKYLTDVEINQLKKDLSDMKDNKYALFIYFALCTGARLSEITILKKEDFTADTVVVKGLKGSNIRELPVPRWLSTNIRKLEGEFPLKMSKDSVKRYWHFYRPNPDKPFHCLRHTFAIQLYKKSKDIRLVKYALGHKSIRNTMIYQDYTYQVHELKSFLT